MTIQHHISNPLLMRYAAGSLPEAFGLVVATHVSLCDTCRAQLGAFDALGGAVMDADDAIAPLSEGAFAALMGRLEGPAPEEPPRATRHGIFPGPLVDYVGGGLADVKWKSLGQGLRQAILPTAAGASARLLYIPAGRAVPDHSHGGLELTLVLQGAFSDCEGRYGVGDVDIAGEAVDHTPIAEAGADCICLAATDAPLKFRGVFPRLLQPLFRI
jgi:putative transcriptional regulator